MVNETFFRVYGDIFFVQFFSFVTYLACSYILLFFLEYCEKRFFKVFKHSFNKKLDEVIVVKKIYPGIP